MKNGRTLTEVAQEIDRQQRTKRDYLAATNAITIDASGDRNVTLKFGDQILSADDLALRQIGEHTGVPAKYFDRMRTDAPALLANNLNHWLHSSNEKRLIRTLDNHARAFLSDRYQRIDHADVAEVVLPALSVVAGLDIVSCEITDRKLYIKAVTARVQGEVKRGDVVQAGVSISNSEVGLGALRVDPLLFRLVCLNGLIRSDESFSKYHIGGKTHIGDRHLIEGGDLSRWGVVNAVTRFANDPGIAYDRATDLETIGGKVLDLKPTEWNEIALAA